MLVARTDGEAAKHKGLTYFLMDMEQEAVQVRPLRQITGEAEFNELFIEEARIPDANVVGGVGNGWKVALTTLMNERAGLGLRAAGAPAPAARRPDRRRGRARRCSRTRSSPTRSPTCTCACESIRLLAWKGLTDIERYGQPGPEGSLVKWLWSDTNQRLTQLAADIVGPEALTAGTQLELRAAARPRQHDRGRHHRGAQEHRRRARARPPAAEGGGVAMDFGLTDDQRDIQRTARELLGRPRHARARARARRGRRAPTTRCGASSRELGWPGIAVAEEHGGQGLGAVELAILCEELGRSVAPVPFLPTVLAATLIEHAGSDEQRARWLPGLASGELTGAVGDARRRSCHGGAGADVFVLVSGGEARAGRRARDAEPVASIDSTPPRRARGRGRRRGARRRRRGRARPRARRRRRRARRRLRAARWR